MEAAESARTLQTSPIHSSRQSGGRENYGEATKVVEERKDLGFYTNKAIELEGENSSDVYEALKSSSKRTVTEYLSSGKLAITVLKNTIMCSISSTRRRTFLTQLARLL